MSDPPAVRLSARIVDLPKAHAFVSRAAECAGMSAGTAAKLALACEEVFVNICQHAYPEASDGWVEMRTSSADGRLRVEVSDGGIPFDGPSRAAPDISSPLEARAIGGLGWLLICRTMDAVEYRRDGDINRLQLTLSIADTPPSRDEGA